MEKADMVHQYIENMLDEYYNARKEFEALPVESLLNDDEKFNPTVMRLIFAKQELNSWIDTDENWEDLVENTEEMFMSDTTSIYPKNELGGISNE